MSLTMKEKQAVTKQLALEYKQATKTEKGRILDSVIQLTQYNRSYAARPACSKQGPAAACEVQHCGSWRCQRREGHAGRGRTDEAKEEETTQ